MIDSLHVTSWEHVQVYHISSYFSWEQFDTIQNSYKLNYDMADQIENFMFVIIMGVKLEEILGSFLL